DPGYRDIDAARPVPAGLGRLLYGVDVFRALHRLFPGQITQLFLSLGKCFGINHEALEKVHDTLEEAERTNPEDFDVVQSPEHAADSADERIPDSRDTLEHRE